MTCRLLQVSCILAFALTCVPTARAVEAQPPTVFDGAYQGLLVGGTAGLATGYLFARSGGWNSSSDWKPLVYGAGIGALAGATVGLTLGIVDMAQRRPGRNGYVMRDGLYGAGLGAVLGGIAGGLAALSSKKGEHILLGGSIGILSGTCLGMGVGAVEGYRRYSASVAAVEQAGGGIAFLPAFTARF
jgi:hypothetical protein